MNNVINLLSESPDTVNLPDKPYILRWKDEDACTFFISKSFTAYSNDFKVTHGDIMFALAEHIQDTDTFVFAEEFDIHLASIDNAPLTFSYQGDFSIFEELFMDNYNEIDRKRIIKICENNNENLIVGRAWLNHPTISLWNNINLLKKTGLKPLHDFIKEKTPLSPTHCQIEVVNNKNEWEMFDWKDLTDKLISKPIQKPQEIEHHAHAEVNPGIRKRLQQNLGMRPKIPALSFADRYALGESVIKESPDAVHIGKKYTNWEQPDANTFIISPDFSAIVYRQTHGYILKNLYKLTTIKKTFNFPKEIEYQGIKIKGDLTSIKHIISKREENRSIVLRYSAAHNENIIVGRVWKNSKIVSIWNSINDISLSSIENVQASLEIDGSNFIWEIFEKEPGDIQPKEVQYTLDELENKLLGDNETEDFDYHGETKPTQDNKRWDQLHLTTPDKKGDRMKAMGIKPKAPMGAHARFLRGESKEY